MFFKKNSFLLVCIFSFFINSTVFSSELALFEKPQILHERIFLDDEEESLSYLDRIKEYFKEPFFIQDEVLLDGRVLTFEADIKFAKEVSLTLMNAGLINIKRVNELLKNKSQNGVKMSFDLFKLAAKALLFID